MRRIVPILVLIWLIVFAFLPSTAACEEGDEKEFYIHIEAEEPGSVASFVSEYVLEKSPIIRLTIGEKGGADRKGNEKKIFRGTFIEEQAGRIVLELVAESGERRSRAVPWLASAKSPISRTVEEDELPAFIILLENIVFDFSLVQLSVAPSLGSSERDVGDDGEGRDEGAVHTVSLCGGVKWTQPGIYFPQGGVGYNFSLGEFSVLADLFHSLTAEWRLGADEFRASEISGGVGLGYKIFRRGGNIVSVEVLGFWQRNRFKRISSGWEESRGWWDFGGGGGLYGRYNFAGSFGLFFRPEAQVFFNYHKVKVKDGGEAEVNIISVPLTLGVDYSF
ncbi:MAG: hypothetical protein Kow0090_12910 [Myxococcota bacterium]